MAAHSENSIKIHASKCKGKLKLEINKKPGIGSFELYTCDSCTYVGRGKQVPEAKPEAPSVRDYKKAKSLKKS